MTCFGCGTQQHLASVEFLDINSDIEEDLMFEFCADCMEKLGYFCEIHGTKTAYYLSDGDDSYLFPGAFCQECCEEQIENLSLEERTEILQKIKLHLCPDDIEKMANSANGNDAIARDTMLLYNFFLTMTVGEMSFEATLTELMLESVPISARNN